MRELLKIRKFNYIKLFSAIFMIGFVGGIVFANFFGQNYLNETGIFSDYFIASYRYVEVSYSGLFFMIFKKRLKWILLLWGMGLTFLGIPLVWGACAWLGFSAGLLLSVSVIRFGFLGIIICFLALVPHGLIYIPVFAAFLNFVYIKSLSQYKLENGGGNIRGVGKQAFIRYLLLLGVVILAFCVGIFLESYINPLILRIIINKI